MPDESTAPDLVELTRRLMEAANRHDLDTVMRFYAPDAVWDLSDIGTYQGAAAVRSLLGDWWGTWGDHLIEVGEILDLGHGVVFSSQREDGRLAGSEGHVEQPVGWVFVWVDGLIESQMGYRDIDKARAAAERLAESRE